jgi:SAM-dependent methyltransferase
MLKFLKTLFPKRLRLLISYYLALQPIARRECNICGFKGYFDHFAGPPLLNEVVCPSCGSHSRHRIFWDWFLCNDKNLPQPIYHFAPERVLEDKFRLIFNSYVTADIMPSADCILDIQSIDLPSAFVGTVICNHVLEHVPNDMKALRELHRIIKPGGYLIISIPIIDGWDKTYENSSLISDIERTIHFGQRDHLRTYGHNFDLLLKDAGFMDIEIIRAFGENAIKMGLIRGEKLFICKK